MIIIKNFTLEISNKIIFKEINLKFESNNVFGIFGFNAIGKTSFFRSMYGLLSYKGEINYYNNPITKNDIAYLETEPYFYPNLNGKEYLNIIPQTESDLLFKVEDLASLLSLPLDEKIDTYSTGMKKKISFLAMLKTNRPVFLLDEPFNGVDIESVEMMKSIINKLKESGKTIIITSHKKDELLDTCNYFLVFDKSAEYYLRTKEEIILYINNIKNRIDDAIDSVMTFKTGENL